MTSLLIAVVVVLVIGSAFFSSAEIALNSSSPHKLRSKAEAGDKRAIRAQRLGERYTQVLSTILVGNNLVNIATTSVITVLAVDAMGPVGQRYAELITTLLLLICGEIVPKILAAEYCNQLVLVYSGPLQLFATLFKPVVWVVAKAVGVISPLWTPKESGPAMTDEELVMVVESIQDEGVITESEGELIKSAIEFADITAHEIMTPRVDLLAVDVDDGLEELLSSEDVVHYTRIPVYEENVDHIVGIVNISDVLKRALEPEGGAVDLRSLMVEPKFVHMTKNISDLLKEMRDEGRNMAVVLDAYGGTAGIVTMEDILEELVGDIFDETDEDEEPDFTEMSEHEFLMDGDMNIYDVFDLLDYEPRDFESDYTTLGGWITEMLDRFPQEGDSFTYDRLTVTVLSVEERRVTEARILVQPEEEEEK